MSATGMHLRSFPAGTGLAEAPRREVGGTQAELGRRGGDSAASSSHRPGLAQDALTVSRELLLLRPVPTMRSAPLH